MSRAYGDEAQPGGTGSGQPYYLTATILLTADRLDDYRDAMLPTRPKHLSKQRWSDADRAQRERVLSVIEDFEVMNIVVVNELTAGRSDVTIRNECLLHLLYELDLFDVTATVLEARTPTQDKQDRVLLDGLRASKTVRHGFRIDHIQGREEPPLWIPDAIGGVMSKGTAAQKARVERSTFVVPVVH